MRTNKHRPWWIAAGLFSAALLAWAGLLGLQPSETEINSALDHTIIPTFSFRGNLRGATEAVLQEVHKADPKLGKVTLIFYDPFKETGITGPETPDPGDAEIVWSEPSPTTAEGLLQKFSNITAQNHYARRGSLYFYPLVIDGAARPYLTRINHKSGV